MKKILLKGNIAMCEGAIAAGCDAFFGYPITPQNEVAAYMSEKMDKLKKVFLQAESELAAINMVFGAGVAGKRAMTSSSSPGISLMQEGISYLAGCEIPAVIVNVQRGGPGLGNISGSQGDYFQAVKGGGHGDYKLITLLPYSVKEMYEMTHLAFNLADKYRNPVYVLVDGVIGQMMEPVYMSELKNEKFDKSWALNGAINRNPQFIRSLLMDEGSLEKHNYHLKEKYDLIKRNEIRYDKYLTDDADFVLVSYGLSARICKEVASQLRKEGKKIGVFRPVTGWPFPEKILCDLSKNKRGVLVVEMNLGQMLEDVRLSVLCNCPVDFYGVPGGGIPDKNKIIEIINSKIWQKL